MARSTSKDAQALFHSLLSAYASTPTNLKVLPPSLTSLLTLFSPFFYHKLNLIHISGIHYQIIDLYVMFAVSTALIQVVYMAIVGSFPFNSFLSGVLSCIGTAVLAVCLRIQVNKENKEFKDLPPERAFADFVLCNLVLHLVIMNFLG
ncbi:Dolichyl-diphosphooligosaccharide-protein glycosyltransferase subunit dad1 [Ancistrocladus abbreviatus]